MALAASAALVGAFVQSTTGFGFALVLSPALFAVMDPVEAVMALLVLGLALSLLVLFERGRPEHVDWRSLVPMLVAALPGLAVGAVALTQMSKQALQVAVGVAVVAVAAWQLRRRRRGTGHPRLGRGAGVGAGFVSGALTTSINVSGPPIVLWLEARGASPEEFRASLAATFVALDLTGGALLVVAQGSGSIKPGTVGPLLVLVVAGYALGALAFRRLNRERFYTLVLVLVACTGVASIVAGLA
jgi:uncharacterized membrane protein YfcA